MEKPVNEEAVPVTDEQMSELGLERDYSVERDDRVSKFVKDLLIALGSHEFVFASGSREEMDKLEYQIDLVGRRSPSDPQPTPEEARAIDENIKKLTEIKVRIADEIVAEQKTFDSFYETKFIVPAMERGLLVNDLNYTFSLANMAIEMLKSVSISPESGQEFRLQPAAQEILTKLGEQPDLMIVIQDNEGAGKGLARQELYTKLYLEIVVPVFDKYEVKYNEVLQVFGILQSLIAQIKARTDRTIAGAREIAEAKLWGLKDRSELTIEQLHKKCIEKDGE